MNEENLKNEQAQQAQSEDFTVGEIVDSTNEKPREGEIGDVSEQKTDYDEQKNEQLEQEPKKDADQDVEVKTDDETEQQGKKDEKVEQENVQEEIKDAGQDKKEDEEPAEDDIEPANDEANQNEDDEKKKLLDELEELKAQQRDEENLRTLEKVQKQAELAYNKVCNDLSLQVQAEFEKYGIDKAKTLDEIQKEDPAKAAMAQRIVQDALQIKQAVQQQAIEKTRDAFATAVFSKAERLFDKYNLTLDQQNVAAETFLDIMFEAGINNLDGDLEAKVKLSVGAAKLQYPDKVEREVKAVEVHKVEDIVEEVKEHKTEEQKQEQEEKQKQERVEDGVAELMESAAVGEKSTPTDVVTKENVLQKLEALPHKERCSFYAQYADLVDAAMRNQRLKTANKED